MQQYFVEETMEKEIPLLLNANQYHHIVHVMRMKDGDSIRLADNSGKVMLAHIQIKDKTVWAIPYEAIPVLSAGCEITLIMGLIKGERWEFVIQKAAELGVARIVPILTRYSVVKITKEKLDKKIQRWQSIALEACEQCERATICKIEHPITMEELDHFKSEMNLIAYERADARSLHLAKKLRENTFSSISVLVGCEGGFAKEEVEIAKDKGFFCISLGPRILRAETAAISLLANIDYEVESRNL